MIHLDKKGRELKAIYEQFQHTFDGNTEPSMGPLNGNAGDQPPAPLYEDPAVQAGLLNGIDGNQPPAPIVEQLPLVPQGNENGIDGMSPPAPLAETVPLVLQGNENGINGTNPPAPLVESPSAAIEDGAIPEKNGKVPCPVPMQPVGNYTGSTWVESGLRNKIRSFFQ